MVKCVLVIFFCDSQSAINFAMHQNLYYRRTKHIEIKFHYIRDNIAKGKVLLDKVHINDNPANM